MGCLSLEVKKIIAGTITATTTVIAPNLFLGTSLKGCECTLSSNLRKWNGSISIENRSTSLSCSASIVCKVGDSWERFVVDDYQFAVEDGYFIVSSHEGL